MIAIPEFKQYFVTGSGLPLLPIDVTETPVVNEGSLPKFKVVDGMTIGLIFLEDNEPSEEIYRKLFESITFKTNTSDRARTSNDPLSVYNGNPIAGLVQMSTDLEAKTGINGDVTKISRAVYPSQLPSVIATPIGLTKTFDIGLIPTTPVEWLGVTIQPDTTKNVFGVSLSPFGLDWLEAAFNATKQYIDTVNVVAGSVLNTPSGMSALSITVTPATDTNTKSFLVSLLIGLDNDPFLVSNAANVIPSQQAVKTYVDNSISMINAKADQADLLALEARVFTMEGGTPVHKATQADLLALTNIVNTKLSKTTNDTANGVITFVQSPIVPSGATGSDAINEADVVLKLANYYTKLETDNLLNVERVRISVLEGQIVSLQDQIQNLQNDLVSYVTLAQANTLFAPLSHNHDTVYHPLVAAAVPFTGDVSLQRLSQARIEKGILIGLTT